MSTELTSFENKHLAIMAAIVIHTQHEKDIAEKTKKLKADLEKAMVEHDIKSIDNHLIKITRVDESSSKSIDMKKLEKEEPKLYGELLEDYPKTSVRKAHVKFTVK